MKKDMKGWAIKIRNRSFYLSGTGAPWTFLTQDEARQFADNWTYVNNAPAKPIRIKLRIEEIT